MSTDQDDNWKAANWSYLLAAIGELGAQFEQSIAPREEKMVLLAAASQKRLLAMANLPASPAIDTLSVKFGLSDFERQVILLCAGMELDSGFPNLCARLQRDPMRTYPTFGLALAALEGAHWSALSPDQPLRFWRLVELGSGSPLTASSLRLDERILHYLIGLNPMDERLAGLIEHGARPTTLAHSQLAIASQLSAEINISWKSPAASQAGTVLQVNGPDTTARQTAAALACQSSGLELFRLRVTALPGVPAEQRGLQRLWEREARLANRVLLVDLDQADTSEPQKEEQALFLADSLTAPLILSAREQRRIPSRPCLSFYINQPGPAEALKLWEAALAECGLKPDNLLNAQIQPACKNTLPCPTLSTLADQFLLNAQDIRATVQAATAELNRSTSIKKKNKASKGRKSSNSRARLIEATSSLGWPIWEAARQQARPRLGELAERIETNAEWADLVLPIAQADILEEIAVHMRQRFKVYETWGFAGRIKRGLGITALFTGVSGTGKTLAGEVLAHHLRLDLYKIDLSQVVSKYIGETEKNLRQVFDAAEMGGAILFFDEADALFGKRSEVKDSHDRYANLEISYLLQRMEAYRGLAILASNMKEAMDQAFLRRLRFVVHFPVPEPAERARIWQRIFPTQTPTQGLDPAKLARLNINGGSIRNVALHAAFLAAEKDEKVQMAHILQAARGEYARMERTLTENEIRGWL